MNNFRSNAEEIRYFFEELLRDEEEHDRKELIDYVKAHSPNGSKFTEGMFTGALRNLLETNPVYQCIRRGIYQKIATASNPGSENIISDKLLDILINIREQLKNCNVNVFDIPKLSEQDKKIIGKLGYFVSEIDSFIETLQQNT